MRASTARPAKAPSPAGRQPRTVATASTTVSASTASTNAAKKPPAIAGQTSAKLPVTPNFPSRDVSEYRSGSKYALPLLKPDLITGDRRHQEHTGDAGDPLEPQRRQAFVDRRVRTKREKAAGTQYRQRVVAALDHRRQRAPLQNWRLRWQ